MAGIAASVALAAGAALASCRPAAAPSPPGVPPVVREPSGVRAERPPFAEPRLRVGVQVAVDSTTASSPAGLRLLDRDGGAPLGAAGPHEVWRFRAAGGRVEATPAAGTPGSAGGAGAAGAPRAVIVEPLDPAAPLFLGGQPYRGTGEILALPERGLNAVNLVGLEAYLLGVVPIEIGARPPAEFAAVAAQAVAARTYAAANLGSHAEMGFDLFATVADQVYGGMLAEREDATRAVRETAGWILTWEGEPIRAYYHSTCGGRTAAVTEVLDRPDAPYLRPVDDVDASGNAYCAISPRYRWTASFDRSSLDGTVRAELARYFGVETSAIGPLERLEVRSRTPTGRVRELAIRGPGSEYVLDRNEIRFVLRGAAGEILNSTAFEVMGSGAGAELHGRGYGHGVGLCQYGAIGRARAGQSWETILTTYYAGARLTRAYGEDGEREGGG